MKTYEVAGCAALAAISAAFQIVHVGYPTPWGMWLDVVTIPWILAFFLYCLKGSLVVSVLGALIITLVAPSTWLGASMKWLATLPMWLMLGVWCKVFRLKLKDFGRLKVLLPCLAVAIVIRGLIMIPAWCAALPLWLGWSFEQATNFALSIWYIIFGLNGVQGLIDVLGAWLIMFKFRLTRFATWE